jgi:misacylated tRNA(Ala) deacylase
VTELLYLASPEDAYRSSFTARVTALPPGGVVLDRTLFYPVGGGQPSDHGELVGANGRGRVVDVTRSGAAVVHRLGRSPGGRPTWEVGEEVSGTIEWPRRHRHMRAHTAQHLLSGELFARWGLRTRRAVMGAGTAEIELEGPAPSAPTLDEVVASVQHTVESARPVVIRFLPRAEYDRAAGGRSGLVPLAPQVDPVRVIEVEAADRCACGGTHVRSTVEIGRIVADPPSRADDGAARVSFRLEPEGSTATPIA